MLTCVLNLKLIALQFDPLILFNSIVGVLLVLKLDKRVPAFHNDVSWIELLKQVLSREESLRS